MSDKENVIKLPVNRGGRSKTKGLKDDLPSGKAPVLDMTERREERLQDERRKVRRTMLSEFVGVHVVVPGQGLMRVTLYDISGDGLAFDTTAQSGRFRVGDEVAMRVYLNRTTYFPFNIRIGNVRDIETEASVRHGASFVKGSANEEALGHFVRFIESVSATLATDTGDVVVPRRFTR
jgi:hypothetical protein